MRIAAALLLLFLAAGAPARADDSPKHAERGVQAYRSGKYDLARMFFEKALQDAVLKGREDWAVLATLNLVDLDLEAMEEGEAERLLAALPARDPAHRTLVLWKRSQLAFQRRRPAEAVALVDSALRLNGKDKAREITLRLDRLRYLIQSREPREWAAELDAVRLRLVGARERGAAVEAAAAMARKDFARSDSLWRAAADHYRSQGRLAKAAAAMNQAALCLSALGRRQEALEMNARAVAVFGELELALPALRAQALRLLIEDDDRQLAKLRQDMDLVGQRFSGFDLQGILDEYSHSLRGAPPLPPGP